MLKILIILIISFSSTAQDEWFFKDMLRGKVQEIEKKKPRVHFHTKSNLYYLDVSGDGVEEYISFEFNDGQIKFELYSREKKLLKDFNFPVHGYEARPYRISRKQLSPTKTLTLIYFFDGKTGYLKKTGTASLYAMVVENKDLSKISIRKISSIFLESLIQENYRRRLYEVGFQDVDLDGQYEVIINSGSIKRILYHQSENKWIGL